MQLEPFSRKIIDRFTLSMYNLFNKLELASYELVEFRIASAGDPVEILRDGSCTILTGSTDYAIFLQGKPNLRVLEASSY